MKIKFLLIFFVVVIALTSFVSIKAMTEQERQALILSIQQQIAQLQAQLQQMLSDQNSSSDWCHTFNTNLGFAQSNTSEVGFLHIALQKQNISYAPDDINEYTNATVTAVTTFQARYGITPTSGYVAEKTRAKLNQLYSCENISTTCTENWQCGAFNTCSNGTQTKSCYDRNSCGTTINKPNTTRSCVVACTEDWSCGAFSTCSGGTQTKTCYDKKSCGTTANKPNTTQSCTSSCSPYWDCTDWSSCSSGNKTRTCTDTNSCGITTGKPAESQSCAPTITLGSINLTSFNTGGVFWTGQTVKITWTAQDVNYVRIFLDCMYDDTTCAASGDIINGTGSALYIPASQGYYDWKVEDRFLPTAGQKVGLYRLRIIGTNNTTASTSSVEDSSPPYMINAIYVHNGCRYLTTPNHYDSEWYLDAQGHKITSGSCDNGVSYKHYCQGGVEKESVLTCPMGCMVSGLGGFCFSGVKFTYPADASQAVWLASNDNTITWDYAGISDSARANLVFTDWTSGIAETHNVALSDKQYIIRKFSPAYPGQDPLAGKTFKFSIASADPGVSNFETKPDYAISIVQSGWTYLSGLPSQVGNGYFDSDRGADFYNPGKLYLFTTDGLGSSTMKTYYPDVCTNGMMYEKNCYLPATTWNSSTMLGCVPVQGDGYSNIPNLNKNPYPCPFGCSSNGAACKNPNCPQITCIQDLCPGKHVPDANGCMSCSSPCQSTFPGEQLGTLPAGF